MPRESPTSKRLRLRRFSPVWIKAPVLLLRSPGVFLSLTLAALILGLASGAGPVFVSSAGNATLGEEVDQLSPTALGLTVNAFTFVQRPEFEAADGAIKSTVEPLEELGDPTVTLLASSDEVKVPGQDAKAEVRL